MNARIIKFNEPRKIRWKCDLYFYKINSFLGEYVMKNFREVD